MSSLDDCQSMNSSAYQCTVNQGVVFVTFWQGNFSVGDVALQLLLTLGSVSAQPGTVRVRINENGAVGYVRVNKVIPVSPYNIGSLSYWKYGNSTVLLLEVKSTLWNESNPFFSGLIQNGVSLGSSVFWVLANPNSDSWQLSVNITTVPTTFVVVLDDGSMKQITIY